MPRGDRHDPQTADLALEGDTILAVAPRVEPAADPLRLDAVMPAFRRDFAAIRERVARLEPRLDEAQARMNAADVGIRRLPRLN